MSKNYLTDHDIYKDDTLLLKKGSFIDNNIVAKLQNFGIFIDENEPKEQEQNALTKNSLSILVADSNEFSCVKTKKILESSILKNGKIIQVSNKSLLKTVILNNNFNFIFIDYEMFDEETLNEIFLRAKEKTYIFITNSSRKRLFAKKYNSEQIKINFLYRTIEKDYINALIKINL
jgi:hypothetical protein